MNCDERRDLLLLQAAGGLDRGEEAELLAHLAGGCPRCAGSLVEAEAVLAHLPLALAPAVPGSEVRERLLSRIAARPAESAAVRAPAARTEIWRSWQGWLRPALAAGVAAVATYLLVAPPMIRRQAVLESRLLAQVELARSLEEQLADQERELRELSSSFELASRATRMLDSPDLLLVGLRGGAQPGASGRILWDREQGAWHFRASGLAPAGTGKTYELWFITPTEKIRAGTFDPDPSGNAALFVKVPEQIGRIEAAAVTDEPEGGSAQPTGSIQLVGSVSA